MPTVKILNVGNLRPEDRVVEVEAGKPLMWALWEKGVPIRHNCGGQAKCTTCRVVVHEGELPEMNQAERERLEAARLRHVRLSCQLPVQGDLRIDIVNLLTYEEMEQWKAEGR